MKAPSAPTPTDPKVSSAADQQAQTGTAIAQTYLNNPQRNNPYGTQTFQQTGTSKTKDANGKDIDVPTFTENISFSPSEQKNYDLSNELNWKMSDMGMRQLDRVDETLSTPLNADGLPEVDRTALTKNYDGYRDDMLKKMQAYYSPELDRQQSANYTDLANRGISEGSEAYREAQALQNRQRSDADLQMYMGAGSEIDRAYGQDMDRMQAGDTARERALQERVALRAQPLNEISALTSGTQVNSPQFAQYGAGNIRGTDVAGQYNNYDQQVNRQYEQRLASHNAKMSGLFGLGGTALSAGARMYTGGR